MMLASGSSVFARRRGFAAGEVCSCHTREFFEAVERSDVIDALQRELQALCQERAPEARWQWDAPPLTEAEVVPVQLPALEQEDLLTNPVEELKRVKKLLKDQSKDQRKDQQTD